jgi:hypothetical protein
MKGQRLLIPLENNEHERFREQLPYLTKLAHPGIAKIFDIIQLPDEKYYLAIDHIDGKPLDSVIEKNDDTFTEKRIVSWMIQICECLNDLRCRKPPICCDKLDLNHIILDSNDQIRLTYYHLSRGDDKIEHIFQNLGMLAYTLTTRQEVNVQSDPRELSNALNASFSRWFNSLIKDLITKKCNSFEETLGRLKQKTSSSRIAIRKTPGYVGKHHFSTKIKKIIFKITRPIEVSYLNQKQAKIIWEEVLRRICNNIDSNDFNIHFKSTEALYIRNNQFIIKVTAFSKDIFERKFKSLIQKVLFEITNKPVDPSFFSDD